MWNDIDVTANEKMIAETVEYEGHGGKMIRSYLSRPVVEEPIPSLVLISHMPGWDEWCRETARRFSQHGYAVACPNIYGDYPGKTPVEASESMRAAGGVPDADVMADCAGSMRYLKEQSWSNGKVGVIGMCSGGRHAFMAACTVDGFGAAVDCWGGGIFPKPEELTPARPVAPIDYIDRLEIPLMGIFGNEDFSPTKEEVDRLEAALQEHGKEYEFHRYDGAGHGIWYYHSPMYRREQAMDSWEKVFAFFEKNLR